MKFRLFIGNLPPNVHQDELKQKFEACFQSYHNANDPSSYVNVGEVEVRCKNDDNYFGYVNLYSEDNNVDGSGPPIPPVVVKKCKFLKTPKKRAFSCRR